MTTVEYLNQYRLARMEISALTAEAAEIKKQLQAVTLTFGEGGGGAPNTQKIPRAFEKIDEIEREITARIGKLAELRMEINNVIQAVPDDTLKTVLVSKYIGGESWEYIAAEFGTTRYHMTHRIHPKALAAVERIREQGGGNGIQ